jgi:methionyl-tRNA formyltransferase
MARALYLGPPATPVPAGQAGIGETVMATADRITTATLDAHAPDVLVSYGYRHILPALLLARLPGRAVNLHISLLPWNRGADPNLWSFVDGTPHGVTIHHLDPGVDTGDIIAQREVAFGAGETLRSSYQALQDAIQALFREHWPAIRDGHALRHPQKGPGTSHRLRDKEALLAQLTTGWDTPVAALRGLRRPSR